MISVIDTNTAPRLKIYQKIGKLPFHSFDISYLENYSFMIVLVIIISVMKVVIVNRGTIINIVDIFTSL